MIDRAKDYFILADQYLETSKLLLKTMIESGNLNCGFGSSELEDRSNMIKNSNKSDSTLFIPALFNCYQGIELFIKGVLLLNNSEIKQEHEMANMIETLKNIYGETNEIYKELNGFYKRQTEIITKFKKINNITTTKELYESLRYPENKGKHYNYFVLKYNDNDGIITFNYIIDTINKIRNIVIEEFNKYR